MTYKNVFIYTENFELKEYERDSILFNKSLNKNVMPILLQNLLDNHELKTKVLAESENVLVGSKTKQESIKGIFKNIKLSEKFFYGYDYFVEKNIKKIDNFDKIVVISDINGMSELLKKFSIKTGFLYISKDTPINEIKTRYLENFNKDNIQINDFDLSIDKAIKFYDSFDFKEIKQVISFVDNKDLLKNYFNNKSFEFNDSITFLNTLSYHLKGSKKIFSKIGKKLFDIEKTSINTDITKNSLAKNVSIDDVRDIVKNLSGLTKEFQSKIEKKMEENVITTDMKKAEKKILLKDYENKSGSYYSDFLFTFIKHFEFSKYKEIKSKVKEFKELMFNYLIKESETEVSMTVKDFGDILELMKDVKSIIYPDTLIYEEMEMLSKVDLSMLDDKTSPIYKARGFSEKVTLPIILSDNLKKLSVFLSQEQMDDNINFKDNNNRTIFNYVTLNNGSKEDILDVIPKLFDAGYKITDVDIGLIIYSKSDIDKDVLNLVSNYYKKQENINDDSTNIFEVQTLSNYPKLIAIHLYLDNKEVKLLPADVVKKGLDKYNDIFNLLQKDIRYIGKNSEFIDNYYNVFPNEVKTIINNKIEKVFKNEINGHTVPLIIKLENKALNKSFENEYLVLLEKPEIMENLYKQESSYNLKAMIFHEIIKGLTQESTDISPEKIKAFFLLFENDTKDFESYSDLLAIESLKDTYKDAIYSAITDDSVKDHHNSIFSQIKRFLNSSSDNSLPYLNSLVKKDNFCSKGLVCKLISSLADKYNDLSTDYKNLLQKLINNSNIIFYLVENDNLDIIKKIDKVMRVNMSIKIDYPNENGDYLLDIANNLNLTELSAFFKDNGYRSKNNKNAIVEAVSEVLDKGLVEKNVLKKENENIKDFGLNPELYGRQRTIKMKKEVLELYQSYGQKYENIPVEKLKPYINKENILIFALGEKYDSGEYVVNLKGDAVLEFYKQKIINSIPDIKDSKRDGVNGEIILKFYRTELYSFVKEIGLATNNKDIYKICRSFTANNLKTKKAITSSIFINKINDIGEGKSIVGMPVNSYDFSFYVSDKVKLDSEKRTVHTETQREFLTHTKRVGGQKVPLIDTNEKIEELLQNKLGLQTGKFGEWLNAGKENGKSLERLTFIQKTAEAFIDLEEAIGIDISYLNKKQGLVLGLGATGAGHARAHFKPSDMMINLTRTKGAGCLAHEMSHFMNYSISQMLGLTGYDSSWFISYKYPEKNYVNVNKAIINLRSMIYNTIKRLPIVYDENLLTIYKERLNKELPLIEKLFGADCNMEHIASWIKDPKPDKFFISAIYTYFAKNERLEKKDSFTLKFKSSSVMSVISSVFGSYWVDREEMLTRYFERYVKIKLEKKGIVNTFLVSFNENSGVWGDQMENEYIEECFDAYFEALKTDLNIPENKIRFEYNNNEEIIYDLQIKEKVTSEDNETEEIHETVVNEELSLNDLPKIFVNKIESIYSFSDENILNINRVSYEEFYNDLIKTTDIATKEVSNNSLSILNEIENSPRKDKKKIINKHKDTLFNNREKIILINDYKESVLEAIDKKIGDLCEKKFPNNIDFKKLYFRIVNNKLEELIPEYKDLNENQKTDFCLEFLSTTGFMAKEFNKPESLPKDFIINQEMLNKIKSIRGFLSLGKLEFIKGFFEKNSKGQYEMKKILEPEIKEGVLLERYVKNELCNPFNTKSIQELIKDGSEIISKIKIAMYENPLEIDHNKLRNSIGYRETNTFVNYKNEISKQIGKTSIGLKNNFSKSLYQEEIIFSEGLITKNILLLGTCIKTDKIEVSIKDVPKIIDMIYLVYPYIYQSPLESYQVLQKMFPDEKDIPNITEYSVRGKLTFEGTYKMAFKIGYCKEYYDNGVLKFEGERKSGFTYENGIFYNEDGSIYSHYKDGKEITSNFDIETSSNYIDDGYGMKGDESN